MFVESGEGGREGSGGGAVAEEEVVAKKGRLKKRAESG